MGSVVVLSEEATQALVGPLLNNLTINGSGQLVMTKKNGSSTTVGYVQDHSQLLHLSADDHTQYAKADGTRGNFATTAQGAKADAARVNSSADITINAGDLLDGYLEDVTVSDDNSSTSNWINRWVWRFLPYGVGAVTRLVTFLNEYGELRGSPAKLNTVWLRVFIKDGPTNPSGTRDPDVPLIQVMDNRTDRTPVWGLYPNGRIRIASTEIETRPVIVLSAAALVPSGTPTGTVIIREP